MEFGFLNKKGQTSIEFMLLIVLVLLYVQTVIQPALFESSSAIKDTMRVGQAQLAAQKLVETINYVGLSSNESKATITLFVPERTTISCSNADKKINFLTTIDSSIERCTLDSDVNGLQCDKDFYVLADTTLTCPATIIDTMDESKVTAKEITVEKKADGTVQVT